MDNLVNAKRQCQRRPTDPVRRHRVEEPFQYTRDKGLKKYTLD
jgi:hypothetical protein